MSSENKKTKICIHCNTNKLLKEFPRHCLYKDNLDTRCRKCIKLHSQLRNKLRKTAPPQPDVCECCGKKPIKYFCLDHDHKTKQFRGWLCDRCNTGIGKLGDNLEGLMKAVKYLNERIYSSPLPQRIFADGRHI